MDDFHVYFSAFFLRPFFCTALQKLCNCLSVCSSCWGIPTRGFLRLLLETLNDLSANVSSMVSSTSSGRKIVSPVPRRTVSPFPPAAVVAAAAWLSQENSVANLLSSSTGRCHLASSARR